MAVESILIHRSPEAVWAALAEFGAISRWASAVDHSSVVTEQTGGIGATRRVQIGRLALLERVVEWEPGSSLGYAIEGLPIVRGVINTWHLEDAGGTTRVSLTSTIDANPLVGRLIGLLMARESRALLAGLKAHLEGTT